MNLNPRWNLCILNVMEYHFCMLYMMLLYLSSCYCKWNSWFIHFHGRFQNKETFHSIKEETLCSGYTFARKEMLILRYKTSFFLFQEEHQQKKIRFHWWNWVLFFDHHVCWNCSFQGPTRRRLTFNYKWWTESRFSGPRRDNWLS